VAGARLGDCTAALMPPSPNKGGAGRQVVGQVSVCRRGELLPTKVSSGLMKVSSGLVCLKHPTIAVWNCRPCGGGRSS
jgi:hypothetical protein